jgi:hypothetical protein
MYTIGSDDETVTYKANWHLMHPVIFWVFGSIKTFHCIFHGISNSFVHGSFLFFNFSDNCLGILLMVSELDDRLFFGNLIFFCPLLLRSMGFPKGGWKRREGGLIWHLS